MSSDREIPPVIILKATTETLQITTSSGAAIDYSVSYADITPTTFAPSSNEGKITTATTTSILDAPASSVQRQVKLITIANIAPSTSNTVTIQKLISGTTYTITAGISLLAGETVQYVDGHGWIVYSSTGAIKGTQTANGSQGQVQFNTVGSLSSDNNLGWDATANALSLSGNAASMDFSSLTTNDPTSTIPYVASVGAPVSGGSSTLSVPVPNGVTAGDLVIMTLGAEWNATILSDASSVSASGFTVAQVASYQSYTNYTENNIMLYKYATGADSGNYTVTFNTVGGGSVTANSGVAAIVRGGPTSGNPFVDTFQTTHVVQSTTLNVPSFTPTAGNTLLVASIWCNDGVSVTTYPSGWTSQANGSGGNGMMLTTLQQATPAATGSLNWGMASGNPDPVALIGTIRSSASITYSLSPGTAALYARSTANNPTLSILDSVFSPTSLQSALYQRSYAIWTPSSAAGVWSGTSGTTSGTAAIALPTTTNNYTAMRRSTFSSVVTTQNQNLGISSEQMFLLGGATGQGGFFFSCRFGFTAIATGMRAFIGFAPSNTVVTANPSTSANVLGFGFDLADTAFTFMHNGASGTATKETIPGQTTLATNNTGYDAYIWSPPNSTTVYYRLDCNGTTLIDSSVSTNLPNSTTMLFALARMSNGTANTAVNAAVIGINRLYVETLR